MPISLSVKFEMAILFSMKRDQGPPFTTFTSAVARAGVDISTVSCSSTLLANLSVSHQTTRTL